MIPKHLEIVFYRHEGREIGKPFGASVINKETGQRFYLNSYSTKEKRERHAPRLLAIKVHNPTREFNNFMFRVNR